MTEEHDKLHLITQRSQPYGSVRRCCEVCGNVSARYTNDTLYYEAHPDRCSKEVMVPKLAATSFVSPALAITTKVESPQPAIQTIERLRVWRCFHCDEVFTTEVDARAHFGSNEQSETACRIKAPGEFALLQALRNAEDELARYRSEDSDILRAMASMQSDHAQALKRAEEVGYARGVSDVAAESDAARKERLAERWS